MVILILLVLPWYFNTSNVFADEFNEIIFPSFPLLTVARGGVTGGFGWVQTHPLSKKAPMRFSEIRRLFGGWGGRVEREKA